MSGYGEDIRIRSLQRVEGSRRTVELKKEAEDIFQSTYKIVLWTKVCSFLFYSFPISHDPFAE